MAGSTQYDVIVAFQTQGGLENAIGGATTKVGALQRAAEGAQGALASLGSKATAAFTGIVESAGGMLMTLGKIGAGSAFAGAIYGVQGLNSQLEVSKNSVAAVLNAQGVSATMPDALQRASKLVKQMQIDARDLPGEFSDLFGIFQTGIGSALQAGLTDESFRALSAKTMAAAKALAVPMDQAGRELSKLLMGSAGMDNTLGMRLGFDADKTYKDLDKIEKKFKDLSAAGRAELITEKLGKFGPSIEAFGRTFDAQWSTLIDNGKQFVGLATTPLFEKAKETLADVNDWFQRNQDTVTLYAQRAGIMLTKAFDEGKRIVLEWGPLLWEFANKAMERLERGWAMISPYLEKAGGAAKGLFSDVDGTLDKIETILKLYIVAKAAGPLLSLGSSALGAAGGMPAMSGWLGGLQGMSGWFGGARGASSALSAFGGSATLAEVNAAVEAKEMATFASSLRNTTAASSAISGAVGKAGAWASGLGADAAGGLATLAAQASAAGVSLSALVAAVPVGAAAAIGDTIYEIADARQKLNEYDAGPRGGHSEGGQRQANKLIDDAIDAGSKLKYQFDDTYLEFGRITTVLDTTGDAADELGFVLNSLAKDADFASIALINLGLQGKQQEQLFEADAKDVTLASLSMLTATVSAAALAATDPAKKADEKKKPTTNHGTIINGNVYLTVTSAAEPGQITRLSMAELSKLRRTPGSSPFVRNYSAR